MINKIISNTTGDYNKDYKKAKEYYTRGLITLEELDYIEDYLFNIEFY